MHFFGTSAHRPEFMWPFALFTRISFFEFMHQVNPEDFPTKEEVEELFSGPIEPISSLVPGRIVNERMGF